MNTNPLLWAIPALPLLGYLITGPAGVVVGAGDVEAQARQVFALLGRALAAAGAGAGDVAKVTVFLLDIDDRPRINPVRQEFFGATRPASTLVQVSALAVPGALLEVEAVAHVPA